MKSCPLHNLAPKTIAMGGTTTIFCEACYDAGHETTACVTFDHNIPGVNRWQVAQALWENLIARWGGAAQALPGGSQQAGGQS